MNNGDRVKIRAGLCPSLSFQTTTGASFIVYPGDEAIVIKILPHSVVLQFDKLPIYHFSLPPYYLDLIPRPSTAVKITFPPTPPVERKCTCSNHQLMWGGCICGVMQKGHKDA